MSQSDAARTRKEAYFIQIENADQTPIFINVSANLGKKPSVTKPLATTMLRVRDDSVLFSVLKLSKKQVERFVKEPLALRTGPLSRLERSLKAGADLPVTALRAQYDGETYDFELKRDENGVASIELSAEGEEKVIELPSSPVGLTIFLTSPRRPRVLAIGWQGYLGKPGDSETVTRMVSQALNHVCGLAEFQILSDITSVRVPAAPGRYQVVAPTRKASDRVEFVREVTLWSAENVEVGVGKVKINVDLDNANPTTSQLLFHHEDVGGLGETFEPYRRVLNKALESFFGAYFNPDELVDLVCNVALSELSEGDLGRLREAAETVPSLHLSPSQFQGYTASP